MLRGACGGRCVWAIETRCALMRSEKSLLCVFVVLCGPSSRPFMYAAARTGGVGKPASFDPSGAAAVTRVGAVGCETGALSLSRALAL